MISSSAFSKSSPNSSSRYRPVVAGELLREESRDGHVVSQRRIYVGREIIIGRDKSKCQWVFDDPYLSAKHLRVYTVVYENEADTEVDPLVYAEDLSRYGVFWNGSLIGKGNGGYLLSHNDRLRLSAQTTLRFVTPKDETTSHFDAVQELEMSGFGDEYVLTDRLLGAGAYGRVFMAHDYTTRTQLACKVIDLRKLKHETGSQQHIEKPACAQDVDPRVQLKNVETWAARHKNDDVYLHKIQRCFREVEILSSLIHPNIVSVDKVFATDNTIYIFQDLVTAGDLFSYLEMKNHKILESEAAVIVRQIVIALQFLHKNRIVHRDLKPDNVMITSMCAGARIVLTDFGAARQICHPKQRMESLVGTKEYAAPEVIGINTVMKQQAKVGYTTAVDLWSLGIVTVLLLTGTVAFADPISGSYSSKLASTCNLEFLQNSVEWKQLRSRPKDFLTNLLVLDETKRLTATSALEHQWFSNEIHKVDFEELYQRTVKDWRPRTPKTPTIKFQDKSKIRSLPCSRNATDLSKKQRATYKPVEPPHKPFPRRMYLELWQARAPDRTMPDEVKTAILEHWSHKALHEAKKVTSCFKDISDLHKKRAVRDMESRGQTPFNSPHSVGERVNQSSRHAVSKSKGDAADGRLAALKQVTTGSQASTFPCQTLLPKAMVGSGAFTTCSDDNRDSIHHHKNSNANTAESVIRNTAERSYSLPLVTSRRPASNLQTGCVPSTTLKTKSMSIPQKRRRVSIFDLIEEHGKESENRNDPDTPERPRTTTSAHGTDTDEDMYGDITPHHKTAMVKGEYDLVEKSTYLPRI